DRPGDPGRALPGGRRGPRRHLPGQEPAARRARARSPGGPMKSRPYLPQVAVPFAIVAIVVVMVIPLPVALLDTLLAANITAAIVVLLTAMLVREPLEFSVFPALLLV